MNLRHTVNFQFNFFSNYFKKVILLLFHKYFYCFIVLKHCFIYL